MCIVCRGYIEKEKCMILYQPLQNPASLLWAENAEFIVDEFYRERERQNVTR
jgi:hypothetical protein